MSQENIETVRRGLEAFNRRDLDELLAIYDPDVEVITLLSGMLNGRAQLRAAIEQMDEEMEPVHYLPDEFIDAGDTIVMVVRAVDARGRHSGVAAGQQLAFVLTVRSGLIARHELFRNKAEALEAVGLSE
jgi:ketosteroid isomerase-like protein